MENYISKATDAFLTSRPYGIRLDFKHKVQKTEQTVTAKTAMLLQF